MHRPSLHRASSALLVALCAACAHSGTQPPSQTNVQPNTVRVEGPEGGVLEARTSTEERSATTMIGVAPDVAWSKIAAVYAELGLAANTYVDATKQIAARGMRARGRLGKLRMSSLVSCGSDVTGDDKANSYEITLDVSSTIQPAPGGKSYVVSMVTGQGRPMTTNGEAVHCASTGSLEKRIATSLAVKSASTP